MYGFVRITIAVFTGLMICISQVAYAQDQEVYMREGATQQDYINALQKTRSIRPVTGDSMSPPETSGPQAQPTGLSIKIYFGYGSAELTQEAKGELDNLGAALTSPDFSGERWGIEGHTDATGNAGYNMSLSEQRALSVQDYLTTKFGIDPSQLVPVGKGEEELYDPDNPYSGINRRVRINYLGG
jgi:outer membrane protein OmpA-like peptidoglycan-associated protein